MSTPYELWLADKKKREQAEKQGKINFKEASQASRPQYTLPQYHGRSEDKKITYQWESDLLKPLRGMGRSYNDKYSNWAKRQGMSRTEAEEYRRSQDFEEDRKQTYKLNDDGTPNNRQNVRAGQGAMLQSEVMDGIFKSMNQRISKSFQESKEKQAAKEKVEAKKNQEVEKVKKQFTHKTTKENSFLDDLLKMAPGVLKQAVMKKPSITDALNVGIDYAKEGKTLNPTTKELARGVTRTANTAALGLIKELSQKKKDSYYNNQVFNEREGGKKAADVAYDMLGYIAPGEGVYSGLTKLMGKDAVKGISGKAIRGALAGGLLTSGEVGVSTAVNPEKQNAKQNLEHILLGTAIGGVADPALALAGQGITKGFESAANRTMNKIVTTDKNEAAKRLSQILKTYHQEQAPLPGKPDLRGANDLIPSGNNITNPSFVSKLNGANTPDVVVPKIGEPVSDFTANVKVNEYTLPSGKKTTLKNRIDYELKKTDAKLNERQPIVDEFDDAVKKQYDYLKNSMGKGVQPGGLVRDKEGYVVNAYGSVSNNPQWYQDFYRVNGRKPNNAELRELAVKHVKEGFQDEIGDLPAWQPKQVQEIDNQIEEIASTIRENPEQEPVLSPILEGLQEDKVALLKETEASLNEHPILKQQKEELLKTLGTKINTPDKNVSVIEETLKGKQPAIKQSAVSERATKIKEAPKPSKKISQPVVLKTITPKKDVNTMSKKELQSVYKQLRKEHSNLSKAKGSVSEQKLKEVQNDMEQVQGLLMKLDLQLFGEVPPIPDLPDTRTHIGSKAAKNPINIKNTADKAYIKTVDNLHRLSQFDHTVEKVLGKELKASESTHTLGLNSRGSDMISKQILTQNMVNKNGEVVGKSLKEITMKVPKNKLKDFEDYLVNQHAITRMERGEKVFPDEMEMTTDKSKAIVQNYETAHPEFKEISKEYYEYNKQLGQKWLVDTGILSKDQWEGYLKANPHYVPNNRIFSDIERPLFYGSRKGFANQANPVKKAVGSQRKIVSPIESTIEHTAQYIKTAKRNEVMQTLINNIKQKPEAFKDWAEIVPTDKTPSSIMEALQKEGVDGVLENLNKGFDQKPDLTKGNIVTGIIDGQKVHVKVSDPYLLDAITNLTPQAQNIVIHSLGQVTRVMKNLTTGINPVFSLTRNIWRDIPTAFANSKTTNNPLVFSKDLIQSVISVFKNDELYRSFKAIGGGHSSPISSDINLLAQSKRAILPQKGVKPLLGKLLGGLENLNNAVEAAPRLGEFKRLAGSDYDSKMKALFEANDVTVNFNKYGNVTKEVDAVIPYLNAAVQGLDKTWRALISSRTTVAQKTVAGVKAFTAVTIPSMALFALNHDNPDYKKLSNYIKDTNFLIPKGDGTFFKIPKSRELGALFGTDVERLLKAWVDKDPKAFNEFGTYMLEMFAPPTRSIAAPLSDLRSNKNFMDAPIVPGDLEGLTPRYQYDSQTSEVSKKIGNLTNTSPKQLDYLIKSYSGIIGELGIPATTKNSSVGQTLVQKVTADPVFSNDIQREFYDTKTKLDQAHNDLAKQGVKSKNLNEQLRKTFSKKSLEMGKVRKQMKEVQKDSSISPKERLKQLRELQERINQIAESGNELAR